MLWTRLTKRSGLSCAFRCHYTGYMFRSRCSADLLDLASQRLHFPGSRHKFGISLPWALPLN